MDNLLMGYSQAAGYDEALRCGAGHRGCRSRRGPTRSRPSSSNNNSSNSSSSNNSSDTSPWGRPVRLKFLR